MSEEPKPEPPGRTALLLGATGLVGRHTLDLLLEHPAYARVRVPTRRPLARRHPRLEPHVLNFERLGAHPEWFAVDDVFCCLGTTIGQAGSQDAFRRVDLDHVARAASLAAEAGADQFLVVSSLGADPGSRVFYSRIKGEMEAAVKRLPFRAVWIVRPSLLLGQREEFRLGEWLAEIVSRPLAPLLVGRLRRYRPVHAREVAAALVRLALSQDTGGVVESEQIPELARPA